MIDIVGKLYVGSDHDAPKAKAHGFTLCAMCKEGPDGHRAQLGYKTPAAPKGKDYYFVENDKHFAANLIDSPDPTMIPKAVILPALKFIHEHLTAGENVLVHCNQGHSRGPTTALMYLRTVGEMPHNFVQSEKVFRTLYPAYNPGQGMRQFARSYWSDLKDIYLHA